jgi:hypothetical protein
MSFSIKNILPMLMLVVAVWGLFGFLRPEYSVVQDLRTEKKEYADALDNAYQVRIVRQNLLATYDSFSPTDVQRLQTMLPDKADGVQLARDVAGLALVFGITIDSFSFSEIAAPSEPAPVTPADPTLPPAPPPEPVLANGTLELVIGFKSTYPSFMSFARELEKSLELSDIVALALTGDAKDDSKAGGASASPDAGKEVITPSTSENKYKFSITLHSYFLK